MGSLVSVSRLGVVAYCLMRRLTISALTVFCLVLGSAKLAKWTTILNITVSG
jgi:hypothetical protein